VFGLSCECAVVFNHCTVVQCVCPDASTAARGIGAAPCGHDTLATVRHSSENGEDGTPAVCEAQGKTPGVTGTGATVPEGV